MVSGPKSLEARFLEKVAEPLKTDVPLRDFSHFRIGGTADYFFEAATEAALIAAVEFAREEGFPFYLIGGGYNLLFADEGYRGLIIKNGVAGISCLDDSAVEVKAGTSLPRLMDFCIEHSLSCLEFMAGIPGTVGGAVFGNAGAFEHAIGERLSKATLLTEEKKTVELTGADMFFSYRSSRLKKKHDILLNAIFAAEKADKRKMEKQISDYLETRAKNHPSWDTACAGSYFKNPVLPDGTKIPAAKLLDKTGAKGLRFGGASVYDAHANFIINDGEATSQNVRDLAEELKRRVWEEYGMELEEEVIFLPEFGTLP
jgi:UDP-N-acetylmuramate dehydrogenase